MSDDILWLPEFEEKLDAKHDVSRFEVSESISTAHSYIEMAEFGETHGPVLIFLPPSALPRRQKRYHDSYTQ